MQTIFNDFVCQTSITFEMEEPRLKLAWLQFTSLYIITSTRQNSIFCRFEEFVIEILGESDKAPIIDFFKDSSELIEFIHAEFPYCEYRLFVKIIEYSLLRVEGHVCDKLRFLSSQFQNNQTSLLTGLKNEKVTSLVQNLYDDSFSSFYSEASIIISLIWK